jgi:hypothetical protein
MSELDRVPVPGSDMGGHTVLIDGWPVTYFVAGEQIKPATDPVGFDVFEDRVLSRHPRLRRVLTTFVGPAPVFYDADFAGALRAEPRTFVCRHCQAQLRVLAVDTGDALFSATLAERLRAHRLKDTCAVCRGHLSLAVVEFLDGS